MERIQAQFVGVELHFENLERPKKFYIELHPLARSLENSPQLNTYRQGKRREKPLCWKPGFRGDTRGASAAVRSLRTGGAGSYHRGSRHRAAARVCIRGDDKRRCGGESNPSSEWQHIKRSYPGR